MKNSLIISLIFLLAACGSEQNPLVIKQQPIVLIIAEDHSQSFGGYNQFDPQHISLICQEIAKAGREGVVCFQTIGNPSDSSLVRVTIQAIPMLEPNATLSLKAKQHQAMLKIQAANQRAIAIFTGKVTQLANRPLEASTDVNGFLLKADRLFSEPEFAGYAKYLYVHTDGIQSVEKDTTLVSTIAPDVQLYVSGWKNHTMLSANKPFESSEGFTNFITHILKNK